MGTPHGVRGSSLFGANAMPAGSDPLDIILFIAAGCAVAGLILAVLFVGILAWRQRADERRIRKHLRR